MHTLEIPTGNISLQYPETIQEMTREQYISFAGLNYEFSIGKLPFEALLTKMVYTMLPLSRKRKLTDSEKDEKLLDNVYLIAQTFESFYETKQGTPPQKAIKLDCVECKINNVLAGPAFIGPGDALTGISFGQYIGALNAFHDYANTSDVQHLDALIAHLYKQKDADYNLEDIQTYIPRFSRVDIAIKYGVYLFFGACQQFIVTNKKLEIGGGNYIDISILFKKSGDSSTTPGASIGMLGALYSLGEIGLFGDIDGVAKKPLYDVLVYMAQRHHEALKNEADAKKRRP